MRHSALVQWRQPHGTLGPGVPARPRVKEGPGRASMGRSVWRTLACTGSARQGVSPRWGQSRDHVVTWYVTHVAPLSRGTPHRTWKCPAASTTRGL